MSNVKKDFCCPRCMGTTGYFFKTKIEYQQWVDWNGNYMNAEPTGNASNNKIAECYDCGHRFKKLI